MAVIAEGVATRLDPEELTFLKDVPRDDHGNIRLAEVPLGDMLKQKVLAELESMGIKMTIIAKDIGYELRCQPPISYDREYTRYLGYSAVTFLAGGGTGAMIMLKDGNCQPIKFADLLDPEDRQDAHPDRGYQCRRLPYGAALYDPDREGRPGRRSAEEAGGNYEALARGFQEEILRLHLSKRVSEDQIKEGPDYCCPFFSFREGFSFRGRCSGR